MSYFGHVWSHLRKDLQLEWRSRDSINGMLFFSLLVVVVFSLAFDPTTAMSRQIAGGILWVAGHCSGSEWERDSSSNHRLRGIRHIPSSCKARRLLWRYRDRRGVPCLPG